MKVSYDLTIEAPIETVFAFIEEEDESKEWNPKLESVTNPEGFDPDHPVGTKFVQGVREGGAVDHSTGEVTAYDKPNRLSLRLHHYDYTVHMTYRLTRLNENTRLDYESDLTSSNWFHSLMLPVIQAFNRRSIIRQLHQLRIAAEKTQEKS
ncbi:MAG TPA: SRPBCC family protein [Candidatus Polarisedimenticolaceae bacterium]|nr:SRPBCC family protein [Candidatus Polarisedimenticolaceae bacterium]